MSVRYVRVLLSLKLRLLAASLRGQVWVVIGLAVSALLGLGATLVGVGAVVGLRLAPPSTAAAALVVAGFALTAAWTVIPLIAFGGDETLDPARFALLPVSGRDLAPGLLLAGLVGVPGAATAVVGLATVVTWSRGAGPLVVALPAAVLGVLTCVLSSRLVSTAAARMLAGRRAREAGAMAMAVALSLLGVVPWLLIQLGDAGVGQDVDLTSLARVLGWTPFALAWAAPGDVATGHVVRGVVRLLLAAAVLLAGASGWARLLDRALVSPPASAGGTRVSARVGLLDRLPARPGWAVAARCLRYTRRDPRRITAIGTALVASLFLLLVSARSGMGLGVSWLVGLTIGLNTVNELGWDGSAYATHLLTGLPGRADRFGRVIAVVVWSVPLVIVVGVAGALLAHRPELVPGTVGVGLGTLLAGIAGGQVSGALAPFPMPGPEASPFRSRPGTSARPMIVQLATMAGVMVAGLPAAIALIVGAVWWLPAAWLALLIGPSLGGVLLLAGVRIGGSILDSRGPEILATVRVTI